MLGPLLLLLTLLSSSSQMVLGLMGVLGLILVWRWKLNGFFAAAISLAGTSIFYPETNALLLSGSLLLGLFITALTLQSAEEKLEGEMGVLKSELKELTQAKEAEALNASDLLFKETSRLNEEIKLLEEEIRKGKERESFLECALQVSRAAFSQSEAALKEKLDELNDLRVDHFQMSLLANAPPLPPKEIPVIVEVVKPDHLYQQLKKQFEEKSEVLHETRKSLFHTENTLLSLQLDNKLQELEQSQESTALILQLKRAETECLVLEEEIHELEQIVAALSIPKKTTRSKKSDLLQSSFI